MSNKEELIQAIKQYQQGLHEKQQAEEKAANDVASTMESVLERLGQWMKDIPLSHAVEGGDGTLLVGPQTITTKRFKITVSNDRTVIFQPRMNAEKLEFRVIGLDPDGDELTLRVSSSGARYELYDVFDDSAGELTADRLYEKLKYRIPRL
ncbi:hypothetical protein [Pseudomonas extremaustralis]|uniref:hypothetical protein n=1 Tax=Pseudomonas extremaustralis TaxID=359110 RepID=UPI002307ED71|nr:hypothetical protein [Pseudomonas extremaustralis]MDB1109696.1 hypothetical protein [Pseudomonas extremaustralis]